MKQARFSGLLIPLTLYIFIPVNLLIVFFNSALRSAGLDPWVLAGGNVLLYVITVLALYLHVQGLSDKNAHAFFRSVYGSMLMRMFICILAVIIYAVVAGDKLNKYSLLICFLFYFIYSFFELRLILSRLKKSS
jgi:hypothetical protein